MRLTGKVAIRICQVMCLMFILGLAIPMRVSAPIIWDYELVQRKYAFLYTTWTDEWGYEYITSWANITIDTWNAINQWFWGEHPDKLCIHGIIKKYYPAVGLVELQTQVDNPTTEEGEGRWSIALDWVNDTFRATTWIENDWLVWVWVYAGFYPPFLYWTAIEFSLTFHPAYDEYEIENDDYEVWMELTIWGPPATAYDQETVWIYAK